MVSIGGRLAMKLQCFGVAWVFLSRRGGILPGDRANSV